MESVRKACVLQPNALSIRVSDQVEKLEELIIAEGDGVAFFERTYITGGMRSLIEEGLKRLAGCSSQAVFHLKQAMGGGKTHLLVGFGLLAKHLSLRQQIVPELSDRYPFESAAIAAFNGRNDPPRFFWGEIATQLGQPESFQRFWQQGPLAPAEEDWLQLFDRSQPILILLDELPPYFQNLASRPAGTVTVADIATRAFANLLTAASKKKNVCVVVSDLAAAYETGSRLINRALEDARSELGRQERVITPVDLSTDEVYNILKKRLFAQLPPPETIRAIANAYAAKLTEAAKAKTIQRDAVDLANEIYNTYPFHPRLKNLIALFKENENFKQTRGLLELISLLLRSVWERPTDDVYLLGAQHFDLSIHDVRDKLTEISQMRDVISRDIWDAEGSAHAQIIDQTTQRRTATEIATLLLTASCSTAVNAVKGLTPDEIVAHLLTPTTHASEITTAFNELKNTAWYLHHTAEGRYYFDRQENLTKLLKSLATEAPENKIDERIRTKLRQMFEPKRKTAYTDVLPLPRLDEVVEKLRRDRVLLILEPNYPIPSVQLTELFANLTQKNHLLVLTGEKSHMASLTEAARYDYAAQEADKRIPKGHPQREELENKQAEYAHQFTTTVESLFDKVVFPIQRPGREPQLVSKPLITRDPNQPFDGELQIEQTLSRDPIKLYLDVEKDYNALVEKAELLLWPENQDDTRWSDVGDRYAEQPGMPWLPPRGLDQLRTLACQRGRWEDLGNGYLTKKPRPKRTSVQVIAESGPDEKGSVRLRVTPINVGANAMIFYAEESDTVSESSPRLQETTLTTNALKVTFLVKDPTGKSETGEPYTWRNQLTIRNQLTVRDGQRFVELFVAPRGELRYTLDGSEPRNGMVYTEPIQIGNGEVLLQVLATAEDLETKAKFTFPAVHSSRAATPSIVTDKPAQWKPRKGALISSRQKIFQGLEVADRAQTTFRGVVVNLGQGKEIMSLTIGSDLEVEAVFLKQLLSQMMTLFPPDAPLTLTFHEANLTTAHDLQKLAEELGLSVSHDDVYQ